MSDDDEPMFDPKSNDPVIRERAHCMAKNCDVRKYYLNLEKCKERVESKSYTAETCHEEMVDFMESLDRCVRHKAFVKLV